MPEINKAIKPVESVVLAPLNEGGNFTANNYILFRIGASDLNMWLTNDSYLTFDLVYTRNEYDLTANSTKKTPEKSYIRNANNIFRSIEVLYGGDTIYIQPYNIEQNTIKQLSYGESYMNANFATYTTTKMVRENNAYLALDNGVGVLGSNNSYSVPETSSEITLKNVMIPINQLVPLFMDVCSEGFPVRCLKSQIEFRLYIAEPYRYLVDWDPTVKDFSSTFFNPTGTANTNENAKIKNRFSPTSIKLSNVKMYCAHYVPNPNEAAPIDEKCNVGSGMKYKYSMIQTALRQVDKIARSNNLPFSVTTNNTKSLMLYCHETEKSPTLMYRPNINSLYIKFGSNQLPFQPIAGSSFDTPFEYKFTSDDVLDSIDTYFSETNFDYNYSYKYIPNTSSKPDSINVPTSTFVLMGSNYVSDPSALGSESSRWNSQYQASFNAPYEDPTKLTFVLAVASEYGLIVKDGKIITVNV